MRHVMLALTLILIPATAAAQSSALDRGSLLVDGSASFVSSGGEGRDTRRTSLSLRPGVKYFVIPGLAVGGELLLGYSSAESASSTVFGVGPAVDYYFGDLDAPVQPFVSATTFVSWSHANLLDEDLDSRGIVLRGATGLLYLFSDQVGLSSALFYEWASQDLGNSSFDQNRFGLSFGLSAFVF